MQGILPSAGALRTRSDLEIAASRHQPPPHEAVPRLLEEMCREVAARQNDDPLFLAAYVLWRICWIHPFDDGYGRTARAVSYLVLSVRLGQELPGSRPIPIRIKYAPRAYVRALEAADAACARGALDVSVLQALLVFYLRAQIAEEEPSLPP